MPKVFFWNFRLLLHKSFSIKSLKPKDTEISAVKKKVRSERIRVSYRYIFLNNVSVPFTQYWFFIHCNPLSRRFWFITGKIINCICWRLLKNNSRVASVSIQLRKCFDWCKINITNLFLIFGGNSALLCLQN